MASPNSGDFFGLASILKYVFPKFCVMKNIKFPIILVTAVLFVYAAIAQLYPHPALIEGIYMVSPFLLIWMVYSVLKDGVPSTKTMDEHFYEDAGMHRLP